MYSSTLASATETDSSFNSARLQDNTVMLSLLLANHLIQIAVLR